MNVGAWLASGGTLAVVELLVHGLSGYVHHDCRCDVCSEAKRVYDRTNYRAHAEERRAQMRARRQHLKTGT